MKFECKNKIRLAKEFAVAVHDDQGLRYGEFSYEHHLKHVVNVLLELGETNKDVLASAWLHDAVEDTGVSIELIRELFGERVSAIVSAVTDEPGANRKERKAKTYLKIAADPDALTVKLADRIANVEHSKSAKNLRMFKMYQKEQLEFSGILRHVTELPIHECLWARLDRLFLEEPKLPALPQPSPEI
jgi:(p)ppGpp synthase/HD superfamily hydrolase